MDVRLQGRSPRDKPLNLLFASGIGVVHLDLLDLIGDDIVRRDLYIGRVTNERGHLLSEWFTFRGRQGVIVRGSDNAAYRICMECGRTLYFANGKRYLYPAPPTSATVFQSDLSGLVVPERVYERVMTKNWRRLGVDKLPVVDQPVDGFGVLPFMGDDR